MLQCKRKTVGPTDKSGKMTAGPIKTLGFQDRLSGIALSFDFVNFVNKKKTCSRSSLMSMSRFRSRLRSSVISLAI